MEENPLGRTCLPVRFQVTEDSTIRATDTEIHNLATPGVVGVLASPSANTAITRTPKMSQTPPFSVKVTQQSRNELPSKSPGVKQLISLFSRHQSTPLLKSTARFTATPQSNGRHPRVSQVIIGTGPSADGKTLGLSSAVGLQLCASVEDNMSPQQVDDTTKTLVQNVSHGHAALPLEKTPSPVQLKGHVKLHATMMLVPLPSEENKKGILDDGIQSHESNNSFVRTSLNADQKTTVLKEHSKSSVGENDKRHQVNFQKEDEESEFDQDDVPIPTDNHNRTRSTGNEDSEEDSGQCQQNRSLDVTTKASKAERCKENLEKEKNVTTSASPSPRAEMVRKKFLSMDPSATNDSLKHQAELGLEVVRTRGAPKDLEILLHPGQQKRQKAKDINWDTGIVQPVKFRGDECRLLYWQKNKKEGNDEEAR